MKRLISALQNNGYQIIPNDGVTNKLHPEAVTMEGFNITMIISEVGHNFTVLIFKPNGTKKWYYEKSQAQIMSVLKQIRSFYEWR